MTGSAVQRTNYAGTLRGIALLVGLLLLADSVSQLVQAAGGFNVADRGWRVMTLRLLFTQVTPFLIGLLLVGQYLARTVAGWRISGWVAMALAIAVLLLTSVYARDALVLGGGMDGPALGQLRRSMAQVLVSAGALGLGLLIAGVLAVRTRSA